MGGGRRQSEEIYDDYSDDSFASSDDDVGLPPISSVPAKPCEACVSAFARARSLLDAKSFLLRYKPGDLIEDVDITRFEEYDIPDATTLVVIGQKGSGKTMLIKRIIKLLDSNPFSPDPTQEVSGNWYEIPKRGLKKSICIYDTPDYVTNYPDFKILDKWMKEGVQLQSGVNIWTGAPEKRKVNFVIFVLSASSILKSLTNGDKQYIDGISKTFSYPFLSFKYNKPAVVITNGEKLSSEDNTFVRDYIQNFLKIRSTQIFSISGLEDYEAEMKMLKLLHYCVDKSDKSLELKPMSFKSFTKGVISQRFVSLVDKYGGKMDAIIVFICVFFILLRVSSLFVG